MKIMVPASEFMGHSEHKAPIVHARVPVFRGAGPRWGLLND